MDVLKQSLRPIGNRPSPNPTAERGNLWNPYPGRVSNPPGTQRLHTDEFRTILFAFLVFRLMVSIIPTFWGKCKGVPPAKE